MEKVLEPAGPLASDTAHVVAFPPLLGLAAVVIGLEVHLFRPMPIDSDLPLPTVGKLLVIAAGCLVIAARSRMAKAGTSLNPNQPTRAIVTSGPYRYTRNPVYVALCAANLGIGLILCDLSPIVLTLALATALHFGVILPEERYLERRFGEAYASYRDRVHRWL